MKPLCVCVYFSAVFFRCLRGSVWLPVCWPLDFWCMTCIVCYPFPVARRPQYHQRPIVIVHAGFWRWKLQGGAVKTVGSAVLTSTDGTCRGGQLFQFVCIPGASVGWCFCPQWTQQRPSYLSTPTHGFKSLWAESVGRRICLEGTRG